MYNVFYNRWTIDPPKDLLTLMQPVHYRTSSLSHWYCIGMLRSFTHVSHIVRPFVSVVNVTTTVRFIDLMQNLQMFKNDITLSPIPGSAVRVSSCSFLFVLHSDFTHSVEVGPLDLYFYSPPLPSPRKTRTKLQVTRVPRYISSEEYTLFGR